jgi:glycerol-3-phosphate dehydrogenase
MFPAGYRSKAWAALTSARLDILVIGGGITGAGIARESARLGLRVGLVEQRDFAWGTSSRSSKLVHGGLRYLKYGHVRLTRASVRERKRLLEEGPGLIDPLGFLLATYKGDSPGRRIYGAGLSVYDLLALQWSHRYYSAASFKQLAPFLVDEGLQGGFRYGDAQTDDARLVLRILSEAADDGAEALNYVRAHSLLRGQDGRVEGALLTDLAPGGRPDVPVRATVVVNATGAWADRLRDDVGGVARIRPLRGSHLILPAWRLPLIEALSFLHPIDRRPVFIFPWEGATLVGTTDVDHREPLDLEPGISGDEVAYLMAAVASQFPALKITLDDVVSTFAGVRPVIGTGQVDPSKESRDHVVWEESGLLTVTGGKLTTFRRIALDALKAARKHLPQMPEPNANTPVLCPANLSLGRADVTEAERRRLLGRYGAKAPELVAAAKPGELERIPGASTTWAELRWGAAAESVVHLEDLLLRRTRLGLLLPQGGGNILSRVEGICREELGWDRKRWLEEADAYCRVWRERYSLPERSSIPDWYRLLEEARAIRSSRLAVRRQRRKRRWIRGSIASGAVASASVLLGLGRWVWKRRSRIGRGSD